MGVAVLIIALTVLEGFEKAVSEKIVTMNSHIKITAFSRKTLDNLTETQDSLKHHFGKQIESISPFIEKEAIIKSKKLSEGISIIGISNNNNYSGIGNYLIEGHIELASENIYPKMIIGKKLSEKLSVQIGDKLTIFSLGKNELPSDSNPPIIEQFILSGIFESGMSEYDDLNAYIDLNVAQKLFNLSNKVSGYDIKLYNIDQIDKIASEIKEYLRYPHYVRTIFKVHHAIFSWIELQKQPIPIVLGLIILVAVFNIVGTLLMLILERTNDIGILRSLGANKKQIIKIFLTQGLFFIGQLG